MIAYVFDAKPQTREAHFWKDMRIFGRTCAFLEGHAHFWMGERIFWEGEAPAEPSAFCGSAGASPSRKPRPPGCASRRSDAHRPLSQDHCQANHRGPNDGHT